MSLDRELIVKALHAKGLCDYDGGTYDQVRQSGYECECYEYADVILLAVRKSRRNAIARLRRRRRKKA